MNSLKSTLFRRNERTEHLRAFDKSNASSTRTPIVALFPKVSEVGRSKNQSRLSDRAALESGPQEGRLSIWSRRFPEVDAKLRRRRHVAVRAER